MCKQALSGFNYIPQEMRAYLRSYGYSFSKRACEYAIKGMMRMNSATGKMEKTTRLPKSRQKNYWPNTG